jgi:hypothetical protein
MPQIEIARQSIRKYFSENNVQELDHRTIGEISEVVRKAGRKTKYITLRGYMDMLKEEFEKYKNQAK